MNVSVDPEVLEDIVSFGRQMLRDGLVLGTSGNISVRLDDCVAITPSSVPYPDITAADVVILDEAGEQVGGRGRPSAETPMHLAIYGASDARAIVHTHSPVAVAMSSVLDELPAIHYAIHAFGGYTVRVADYERFGSQDLAAATRRALDGRRGALLRNHGTVVYGNSLSEAYDRALLLEWLATVYRDAKQLGEPNILTPDELEQVAAEARRRRYGEVNA